MVEAERRPGRPARRWIDDILKWCGKDPRDAPSVTEDRTKWRQFVTMGPEEEDPRSTHVLISEPIFVYHMRTKQKTTTIIIIIIIIMSIMKIAVTVTVTVIIVTN